MTTKKQVKSHIDNETSTMIQDIQQWIKAKKEDISENDLLTIFNTICNSKCKDGQYSQRSINQLKNYFQNNLCTLNKFIHHVLKQLDQHYENYSKLIDLYFELITLKLQIVDNNEKACNKFISSDNIFLTKYQWQHCESKLNVVIPNFMDTLTSSKILVVGIIQSPDKQTIIKIIRHSLSAHCVYHLTFEYTDYKIE